jgi:CheY-like chemotaxis protein
MVAMGKTVKKVLLVEDYTDVRKMMSIFLRHSGYEVLEAADGYEALELAVNQKPDLVLMDIGLPVLDGIQATRAIREHEELRNIPIVAVTAYGDFYDEKAREAGCNDVIQKPLHLENLEPLVKSYVSH